MIPPNYSDDEDDDFFAMPAPLTFACSQCSSKFATDDDLLDHKEAAENHNFCRLHNLDFMTEEEHHLHRTHSKDHYLCDICLIEFKSASGMALHKYQLHIGQATTLCPACGMRFKGGNASLAMHFEANQCAGGVTREEMHARAEALQHGVMLPLEEPLTGTPERPSAPKVNDPERSNDLGITRDKLMGYWNNVHGKFVCPCSAKFPRASSFWQHLSSMAHNAEKTSYCVECCKRFNSHSAMIQHFDSGHCRVGMEDAYHSAKVLTGGLTVLSEAKTHDR